MNATINANKRIRSAHPLFPPDQAFLWLPGFAGDERPYCTYNEFREHPGGYDRRRFNLQPAQDHNGAFFIPPFPVSPETYISWHSNVTPPYPYHPVPLTRTLSAEEMEDLGRHVLEVLNENSKSYPDPRAVLRNEFKTQVLVALNRMGLLPLPSHQDLEYPVINSASRARKKSPELEKTDFRERPKRSPIMRTDR